MKHNKGPLKKSQMWYIKIYFVDIFDAYFFWSRSMNFQIETAASLQRDLAHSGPQIIFGRATMNNFENGPSMLC